MEQVHIVIRSEAHSDFIVEVFERKSDAIKYAARKDLTDKKCTYYVQTYNVKKAINNN